MTAATMSDKEEKWRKHHVKEEKKWRTFIHDIFVIAVINAPHDT